MSGLVSLLVWLAFGAITVPIMLAHSVPLTVAYAVLMWRFRGRAELGHQAFAGVEFDCQVGQGQQQEATPPEAFCSLRVLRPAGNAAMARNASS